MWPHWFALCDRTHAEAVDWFANLIASVLGHRPFACANRRGVTSDAYCARNRHPKRGNMKAVPLLATVLFLVLSTRGFLAAAASPQSTDVGDGNKYVHLDRKGDLVVSYPADLDQATPTDTGPLVKYKYIMPTHIAPLNRVSIRPGDDGGLVYEYDLENGSRASQA